MATQQKKWFVRVVVAYSSWQVSKKMEEADNKTENCALCTKKANLRCSGCLIVFYCCKDHQKIHWKEHKQECSAYKVRKFFFAICENQEELLLQISISDNVGRFVMSTRDLRPGEIILKEKALILAPLHFNFNVCLGCNDTQSSLCKRY